MQIQRNTACRVYNRVVRAHKRDNNLFFWIPGFIRSFERVLRVQSRINIRFFLFSSFGVRGKCSTKMISCFLRRSVRTYLECRRNIINGIIVRTKLESAGA